MKIIIGNKTFEVSKEALESNPNEITLDYNGILRTEEEESVFIENHKKEARKEGEQIAVKKYREEYGFQGRSIDKLIEAVKSKTLEEAKIEPNEQLKKLKLTLEEKETALQNALTKVGDKEKEFTSFRNQTKLDNWLGSALPKNIILPKEDTILLLKNKLNLDFDENGNIVELDSMGNIVKDTTTANPQDPKLTVENFFKDNQSYLKPIEGGAGGDDSSSRGQKKSIDDFIEEQKSKGVKFNSEDFNNALKKQVEAGVIDV